MAGCCYCKVISALLPHSILITIQALIAMKKADPTNKRYKLAHIAIQQLLSEADKDEKVAGMNRILAFRTLKTLPAEDFAQLRLTMNLYRRQGQTKDMIEVLDSFKDKKDDKLAEQITNDWPFTREKIQLYIAESRWQELFDLCSSLLEESSVEGVLKYVEMINRKINY